MLRRPAPLPGFGRAGSTAAVVRGARTCRVLGRAGQVPPYTHPTQHAPRAPRLQVLYVTLGVSLASYGLVYAALLALAPALPLLRGRPWRHVQTFASMAATLAIARSPASMARRRPVPPPARASPACVGALRRQRSALCEAALRPSCLLWRQLQVLNGGGLSSSWVGNIFASVYIYARHGVMRLFA